MKEFVQHDFMDEEPGTDLVGLTLLETPLEVAENCTAGGLESWSKDGGMLNWSKKHWKKRWRKGAKTGPNPSFPG